MKSKYVIYNKSCLVMKQLSNDYIDLIFTSPPYWDLKDYGIEEQIGYKQTYEKYLKSMEMVWKECFRVLKSNGVICININSRTVMGKYYPIHLDFYNQLKKIGFKYFDLVLWHKASGIPVGSKKLTNRFEYIIVASKTKLNQNKFDYLDYKNIDLNNLKSWHIIKKAGSILSKHPHPAFYPVKLVERGINLYTQPNSIVMDPFLGIGSTLYAAHNLNRKFVGYEINSEYIETIKKISNNDLVKNLLIK